MSTSNTSIISSPASSDDLTSLLQKIFMHDNEIILNRDEDNYSIQRKCGGSVSNKIFENFKAGTNLEEKYVIEFDFKVKPSIDVNSASVKMYVICQIATQQEYLTMKKITEEKMKLLGTVSKKLCGNLRCQIKNDMLTSEISNNPITIDVIDENTTVAKKITYSYMTFVEDILNITSLRADNTIVVNSYVAKFIQ